MHYIFQSHHVIGLVFLLTVTRTQSWSPFEYYDDNIPYAYQLPVQLPFQPPIDNIIEFPKSDHTNECNCIKLRECPSIMNVLYSAQSSESFSKEIKKFECGYNGFLVCCPPFNVKSKSFRREVITGEPWVWDVVEHKNTVQPTPKSLSSRHNFDEFNHFNRPNDVHDAKSESERKMKKKFYFDFEDPKTFRNCPPSFSDDFDLPLHFQDIRPFKYFHYIRNDASNPNMNEKTTNSHRPIAYPTVPNDMTVKPSTFPKRHYKVHLDKLKLMNSRNCGISINPRIIGGENAAPNQFPWMARLAYRNKSSQLVSYRCSGTFIGHRIVLTAAHCVTNLVDDLEVVFVRLGELDTKTNSCDNGGICAEPQDYAIESIVHHLNYDTPKYANDIAIIRLQKATNLGFINPLCLPIGVVEPSDHNLNGKLGIVAGWGVSTLGGAAANPILQYIRLPIVDTNTCAQSYARFSANSRTPIIITGHQICVQGTTNRDTCQGDSGGPLMQESVDGRFLLVGLVSFGPRACGVSNFAGVYTKISSYIEWIARNV